MGAVERPLLAATTLAGRIHAYRGIKINGEVRVPRRSVRSLCVVPCKATSQPFVIDNDPQVCKVCIKLSKGDAQ